MSILLDGTTGITTPGLTNTGTETIVNLTTTGNTILGDATTDTLNVGAGGLVKDASGNVGIGTATPTLGVGFINLKTKGVSGNTTGSIVSESYDGASWVQLYSGASSGDTPTVIYPSSKSLRFGYGAQNTSSYTEAMRLDSSGNLGLGVTPSTWVSSRKALQVGGISALTGTSTDMVLSSNWYVNGAGSDIYLTTAAAALYQQTAGKHNWFTAPSGTAGTAITFTQAMTLDNSGNLGIGTTSPSRRLHVVDSGSFVANFQSSGTGIYTAWQASGGTVGYIGGAAGLGAGSATDFGIRSETNMVFMTNAGSERMRITSSGNVLIGSSSLGSRTLSVTGYIGAYNTSGANDSHVVIYNDGTTSNIGSTYNSTGSFLPLAFQAGGTERMRILSNGNLLFAKTADAIGTPGIAMYTNGTLFVTRTHPDSGGAPLYVNRLNVNGPAVYFYKDSTDVGNISVTTTNTTYNTSSDYRLKENIVPMAGALAVVSALKPCTYTWKIDGSSGQGFIAHELAEVVPECVTGEKDAVELVDVKDEEGNVVGQEEKPIYQGIDTSFLVATLTAAIQELKAEFDAYKATHP